MSLIPQALTRTASRQVLLAKKHSPHLFFAGGVVGVGVSTVLACRATLQLEKKVDEFRRQVEDVKENAKHNGTEYGQKEYQKDLLYVYIRSGRTIVRLYAPAAAVGVLALGALTGSHIQLSKRNTALTATLAAFMKAHDEYRERVREVIGEEKELDIHQGVVDTEIEGTGKNKEVTKVLDPNVGSIYARVFEATNPCWQKNTEVNRIFLETQQKYFNHKLHARGHVFLNEVYEAIGFEHSPAGQIVGWVLNGDGDGYIDFGIYEDRNYRFVNNLERSIWLDFNVDGPIYDKI